MVVGEKHFSELSEIGFTKIESGVDPETVGRLLEIIKAVHRAAPTLDQSNVPYLNRGHDVLYNLQRNDAFLVKTMFSHPMIQAVLMRTLNDIYYKQIPQDRPNYILRSLIARSGGPSPLPLHIDSFIPAPGAFPWSVQVAIVLQDQSPTNGCTIFVPRSHQAGRYAEQTALSDAIAIPSRAGDIVVWDSRTWHGTTGNSTGLSRWSFIATFVRWWVKQNYEITKTLPQTIYEELTDDEKAVMGFCSMPPRDERERIDIKSGHAQLPARLIETLQSE